MRGILVLAVLPLVPANAFAEGDLPCFTAESRSLGEEALRSTLRLPMHPPPINGRVILYCETRASSRLSCSVVEQTQSESPLAEAALAYAHELETCSSQTVGFHFPINFRDGD